MVLIIWVISPYLFILPVILYITRSAENYLRSTLIISIACVVSTMYTYYDVNSMYIVSNVFVVFPLYLNISLPVIYIVSLIIEESIYK